MTGFVCRNHCNPSISGWLSLGTTRNSIAYSSEPSNVVLTVASFVDSTTVLSARLTRRGSAVYRQEIHSGVVLFKMSTMVVDRKLCVAPESIIAVVFCVPIAKGNSKRSASAVTILLVTCASRLVHVP